ncbi:c-type cytochrome [Pseudomonas sp. zfem002]|uniref:c-type cytochrome n=1 Tax=Pseudomonas sp. zfem002 TaxID=3078197 RepID=UPI0029290E4B|nr:c-type cytochrome [Pseudomonas sp. zfem002]MDU9393923.1 c-type cytochrome [Pseudomonas sp. zfem002]
MRKRTLLWSSALLVGALLGAAAVYGPELVAGYRFMNALDRHYASYEANGGAWPQPQDACALCHGVRGQPENAQYPALAGQPAAYLQAQLQAFAQGKRHSPQMQPLVADLGEARIQALAEYFARQEPRITHAPAPDDALQARGQASVAARACSACHGAQLSGSEIGPRLAGQGQAYLLEQLQAFKQGRRTDPSGAMNATVSLIPDDELQALAHYLAGLAPTAR